MPRSQYRYDVSMSRMVLFVGLLLLTGCRGGAGSITAVDSTTNTSNRSRSELSWKFHIDRPMRVVVLGNKNAKLDLPPGKGEADLEIHVRLSVADPKTRMIHEELEGHDGTGGTFTAAEDFPANGPPQALIFNAFSQSTRPLPGRWPLAMVDGRQVATLDVGFLGDRP